MGGFSAPRLNVDFRSYLRIFQGDGRLEESNTRSRERSESGVSGSARASEPVEVRGFLSQEPEHRLELPLMPELVREHVGQDLLDGEMDRASVRSLHLAGLAQLLGSRILGDHRSGDLGDLASARP